LHASAESEERSFKIRVFEVTGHTLYATDKLRYAVAPFKGRGETAADVEKACKPSRSFITMAVIQTLKDGVKNKGWVVRLTAAVGIRTGQGCRL